MGPARLFRFHRAYLRARDAALLRLGETLGECGTAGGFRPGLGQSTGGPASQSTSLSVSPLTRRPVGLALFDALLAAILSPVCASCEPPLDPPAGGPVCAGCWRSILPLTPPLCDRCGDALRSWRTDASSSLCRRCRRLPSSITRCRSIGAYDGALRAIVHALKYDGRRSLAIRLGAL